MFELLLDIGALGELVRVEGSGSQLESLQEQSGLLEEVSCARRNVSPVEDVAELVGEFATGEEEVAPHAEVDLRESLVGLQLRLVFEEALETEGEEVEAQQVD